KLGYNYPENGTYSPVDQENWKTGTFSLGANIDSDGNGTFAVYSANATKMLLEIYDEAYGEDAAYDYWMVKGSDNIWRAKVKGISNGTLYAFRAWGPNWEYSEKWDRGNSDKGFGQDYDSNGNRFNPNKVLFDPYAKEISHDKSHPDVLAMVVGATGSDGQANPAVIYSTGGTNKVNGEASRNFDTGKYAPKAVVIVDKTDFGTKPKIPQEKAIIYEAHVRGITKHASSANLEDILKGIKGFEAVKNISAEYQGTYKGAAMLAPYLKALGVNTIELLPVHESDNDCNPDDNPGGNYWAYMTYGYFAPDRRYSYEKSLGGPTKEFKEMVKAFHDAGMEVYLDVVFNHSGEGGTWYGEKENDAYQTAELTFMRGLDNSSWYCIPSGNAGGYWESTGCGNNLQCDNPMVRQMILDSLAYWIDVMGVDGYRFDLAPVIGRKKVGNEWVFNQSADTITEIADLGEEKDAEMIAEAWDCQYPGGYQVGNFPEGWGEWNGRYRDAIRSYVGTGNWNEKSVGDYIYGDEANFKDQGGPHKSVNFIVAHDGFTLADLCSYQGAGNAQNSTLEWPFGPSDGGNGDNNNLGFIDWTDENTQKASKRQAARNYIAIQMMSRGVPMIVWGDEFSRTQNGNNNPYNIDSVATWSNYNMINTSSPHLVATGGGGEYHNNFGTFGNDSNVNGNFMFMKNMLNLKANEPALNQKDYDSVKYEYSSPNEWAGATMIHIKGSKVAGGSDYLLCMNMTGGEVKFTLPAAASGKSWVRIADTQSYFESKCNFWDPATIESTEISESYGVAGWSVVILKEVAEREQVKNPTFTPADETFSGSTEVTISCGTDDAKIYYTTDGSVPSAENGTLYSGAISLTSTTTIKAIAVKDGAYSSEIVTKKYTNGSAVETPVLSVPAGDFWNTITVFVTGATSGATYYY
ncbi:MAG: chitobiase/beta-hexosaminidase C-terminal domain-containing protein, partial [Spirochaetales bacterium]|nr:chitobiase/beta-hexosaminidase C-terminal domain-containing protein [Spirochaetales bacterium]